MGSERDMEIVARRRASASGHMILVQVRRVCQWLGRPEAFATRVWQVDNALNTSGLSLGVIKTYYYQV